MKKTLFILVAMVFVLASCSKNTYMDGNYHATFDQLDSHGWNAFVSFTLTEDAVNDVDFDYFDADGNRKSLDTAYNRMMYETFGITKPELYCPDIEAALAAATIVPEFDSIDVVTGATHSTENANELFKAALENAKDGTEETLLPQHLE